MDAPTAASTAAVALTASQFIGLLSTIIASVVAACVALVAYVKRRDDSEVKSIVRKLDEMGEKISAFRSDVYLKIGALETSVLLLRQSVEHFQKERDELRQQVLGYHEKLNQLTRDLIASGKLP